MISFVVPAHNEELQIGPTLDSVHAAAAELSLEYEIVVANDSSTDRTREIALARGARVADHGARQIAASRNAGARAARGDVLVFVDADTRISPAVVRGALDVLRRGAVGGGAIIRFEAGAPGWARILAWLCSWLYIALGVASGCFLFCTRRAFDATGGFDEGLFAAEEIAMSIALRKVGRVEVVREPVLTSPRKLERHSAREILSTLAGISLRGGRGLSSRKGLEIWYGDRG